MEFKSINPYNGNEVGQYTALTGAELNQKLDKSQRAFRAWRKVPLAERANLMIKAGQVLRDNVEEYAKMITLEMGKPISESRGEINKCAWVCDYYAENAEAFLEDEVIPTDAQKSFVRHEPIGAVLAIMPWNFPFWQVFRYAVSRRGPNRREPARNQSRGCANVLR
jgi:succinate-semialdehyde dehydrogenase/glutarate-semialdehyde dehydrogenase